MGLRKTIKLFGTLYIPASRPARRLVVSRAHWPPAWEEVGIYTGGITEFKYVTEVKGLDSFPSEGSVL